MICNSITRAILGLVVLGFIAPPSVGAQAQVTPKNSKEDVNAIGNRNVGNGVNFYSLEQEIALGKQLAREVESSSKLVDDPVVIEYVNRVGQNLVRNSDARVPFTIKVVDSDEVNASALPGGFFFVNSGLILGALEESELAGLMAHEIAHVTARHGTKQATKHQLIPLSYQKFSPDAEREADFLGLQYMYKAGYDPNSYVTFFERIQADEKHRPGTIPQAFSTHPPTPERIDNAQKEIARILPARQEYIVTTSEFDSVKSRLRSIMFARKAQDNPPVTESASVELKEGQSPDEVQRLLGKPNDIITVKETVVYVYPTVKVFFENGKLVNVEERKR